jgi:hypothetical protein
MDCVTWLMGLPGEAKKTPGVLDFGTQVYSDTPIYMTRNLAVWEAQQEKVDYLLMVDSDIVPDYLVGVAAEARPFWRTAWNFMMNRRTREQHIKRQHPDWDLAQVLAQVPPATVAAPYCGPPPGEAVFVFRWENFESEAPLEQFRLAMFDRDTAAVRGGIEEVAAVATGLIMYDLRVFDILSPPWFRYEWTDRFWTQKASTEDVFQTRNTSQLRLPQICLWDCWARHMKTKSVGKPTRLSIDGVHQSLVEAVQGGMKFGERVVFWNKDDIASLSPDPPGIPASAVSDFAKRYQQALEEVPVVKEPAQ